MSCGSTIVQERGIAYPRNRISAPLIINRGNFSRGTELPGNVVGLAPWFHTVMKDLLKLANLSDGWDSNSSAAPEPALIRAAFELLSALAQLEWAKPTVITATRGGGIQFEWGTHAGAYFELECVRRDTAHYFFSDARIGVEEEGDVYAGQSLDEVVSYILRAGRP